MSAYRFSECFAENMNTFGLRWTLQHYKRLMQPWELRFWTRRYLGI